MGSSFHLSFEVRTSAYRFWNIDGETHSSIAVRTSSAVGQMSFKKTSLPSVSRPSGSVARSMSVVPARAYATTSGGLAR
jgi:hypothetical protein